MKYDLKGANDYIVDPLRSVLINRGIEDIDRFLNVSEKEVHSYKLLDNIDEGVDLLLDTIEDIKETGVGSIYSRSDSDKDGYSSNAIVCNYINRLTNGEIKVVYDVHKKKHHGIVADEVPEGTKLVISSDAGTNDHKEIEKLHKRDIPALIADHHLGSYSPHAITINNQLCDYPNKELCGAGIVYKFFKAVDERLGVDYADDYIDLVAVANIADMMDTRELETRYYINEGLKEENIKNPFLKSLIERQSYPIGGELNMKAIAFYVAPLVNATIRMGTYEQKLDMFEAFLDYTDRTIPYKKRGTEFAIDQPLSDAMARICSNVRGKQARVRGKAVATIEDRIKEKELDKNKVLIVNGTGVLDTSLTGLVAMQLTQKYKRPALILQIRDREKNIFGGSGRGFENSGVTDFRQFVLDTGTFDMAQGHANAFGVSIKAKNVEKANDIMNEELKDYEFESKYVVDFIVPSQHCKIGFVKSIAQGNDLWGRGVTQPLVAIEDIRIHKSDIELIGKHKNTLKFTVNGVEFMKFRSNEDEYNELMKNETMKIDVIGTCDKNEFRGNVTYQIKIDDMNVEKDEVFRF